MYTLWPPVVQSRRILSDSQHSGSGRSLAALPHDHKPLRSHRPLRLHDPLPNTDGDPNGDGSSAAAAAAVPIAPPLRRRIADFCGVSYEAAFEEWVEEVEAALEGWVPVRDTDSLESGDMLDLSGDSHWSIEASSSTPRSWSQHPLGASAPLGFAWAPGGAL